MPERHQSSSSPARRRMPLMLPWVLPGLFVAGVATFAILDGDGRDRAAEPALNNAMGHIHGLGVDDAGQTIYIGAHSGFFRASAGEPTERVGDTWQDTMAFLRGEGAAGWVTHALHPTCTQSISRGTRQPAVPSHDPRS